MDALFNQSIALLGSSVRWAPALRSAFGEGMQLVEITTLTTAMPRHALYVVQIGELMALCDDERLALVGDGVLNASNLLILEEDKLLFVPKKSALEGFEAALEAVFKPKLPQVRNPLLPQLWEQLMSEPVVLACQRLCKHMPADAEALGIDHVFQELRTHLHLIQETQECLKHLIKQLGRSKIVSWEARQLLDSANALLMVQSLTATQHFSAPQEEEQEYGQLVQQTLLKFAEQLSAALFRYNEDLAFHWFFTEQKIYLPSGSTLV